MNNELIPILKRQEELLSLILLEIKKNLSSLLPATKPVKILDPVEVMQLLKISRVTLYRLKKKGTLVPVQIGGRDYYLESDILNFFNGCREVDRT